MAPFGFVDASDSAVQTIPLLDPFEDTTGVGPGKLLDSAEVEVGDCESCPFVREKASKCPPDPHR
jgi:hypothetical protein